MRFRIELSQDAESDLGALRRHERSLLADVIVRALTNDALIPSRNRKPLESSRAPTPWEYRIGMLRIFYYVNETEATVVVLGIREKGRRTTKEIWNEDDDD